MERFIYGTYISMYTYHLTDMYHHVRCIVNKRSTGQLTCRFVDSLSQVPQKSTKIRWLRRASFGLGYTFGTFKASAGITDACNTPTDNLLLVSLVSSRLRALPARSTGLAAFVGQQAAI